MVSLRIVAALVLGAVLASSATANVRVAGDVSEEWYAATLDHKDAALSVLILKTDDGDRLVRTLDLATLGIPVPDGERIRHASESYVPAEALEQYRLRVDTDSGRAHFLDNGGVSAPDEADSDLLLNIEINGQTIAEPQLVHLRSGRLLLPEETQDVIRLQIADKAAGEPEGVAVDAVADEKYYWDPSRLRLVMTVPPELFGRTHINLQSESGGLEPAEDLSAVLGYDLGMGRADDGEAEYRAGADLAVSKGRVTCRSRHLWRSSGGADGRLESACTADWPENALSLRVGDAVSRGGALTRPVRYAGVRLGTDYALQPYFVTQPTMDFTGSARVPSRLEIWMDRQLAATRDLPPGPFRVEDVAPVTGAGELRAVITGPSGRRSVISTPFYSDPSLLRPGLLDWSVEAGVLREGVLTNDDRYTDAFGQAAMRSGVTDSLTLEGRVEAARFGASGSLAGFARLGSLGVMEFGFGASRGGDGSGQAGVFGYSYRGDRWNLGLRHFEANDDYRTLGHDPGDNVLTRQSQVNLGLRLASASLSLGMIERVRDDTNEKLATAALAWRVADWATLQLSVVRTFEPSGEVSVGAHLTMPFGDASQATASVSGDPSPSTATLGIQKNPPAGTGIGYRAEAGHGASGGRYRIDGTWRTPVAELHGQARRIAGHSSYQLSASGALLGTGDGVALARGSSGGYAVVSAPAENTGVYLDNQLRGRTDENGRAVITDLRPFEENRLRLEATDLPLDSRISDAGLTIVPGRRSAVTARFKVESIRQIFARLMLESGDPVPVGASVHSMQGETSSLVGYDGRISLATQDTGTLGLRAEWSGGNCRAELETGGVELGVLDLGRVTCLEGANP